MKALTIARIELYRLMHAPGVWLGTISFALVLAAGVSIPYLAVTGADAEMGTAFLLGPAVDLILPLLIILITYGAVAGHRSRGSIHVFFMAPVDRTAVLFGLLISRILLLWTMSIVGVLTGIATLLLLYGIPPIWPLLGFSVVTLVAASVYTCIGVGVSAALTRPIQALATLIGGFIVARFIWNPTVHATYGVFADATEGVSRTVEVGVLMSPVESYAHIVNGILPPSPHLDLTVEGGQASADPGQFVGGELASADLVLALVVLVVWAVVPVLIGYHRFRRADIG